jgi:hypothetical protein
MPNVAVLLTAMNTIEYLALIGMLVSFGFGYLAGRP